MRAWLLFAFLMAVSGAAAGPLPAPLTDADYRTYPEAQVKLGRLLFYDRVLSGTYRVSCATCHNHDRASSNGVRLDGKEPKEGDEFATSNPEIYKALKPSDRHAPALFNLGARQFQTLFNDGRVAVLPDGKFVSPAEADLPSGLRDVLAVQALFPVVTGDEQVGTVDNDVKAVAHLGNKAIWATLAERVRDLPEYVDLFKAAFDTVNERDDIDIVHIGNAIGAFVGTEWRSDQSPFDRFLRGDKTALTDTQKRGADLFYGKAKCSTCHAGALQTDHRFHASIVAQPLVLFDRAKGGTPNYLLGRFRVTRELVDLRKLRTPSLRNVARTPPYGVLGAVDSLRDVVKRHEVDDGRGVLMKEVPSSPRKSGLEFGSRYKGRVKLTSNELDDLVTFLESLTDDAGLKGRLGKPDEVPSSLVLD